MATVGYSLWAGPISVVPDIFGSFPLVIACSCTMMYHKNRKDVYRCEEARKGGEPVCLFPSPRLPSRVRCSPTIRTLVRWAKKSARLERTMKDWSIMARVKTLQDQSSSSSSSNTNRNPLGNIILFVFFFFTFPALAASQGHGQQQKGHTFRWSRNLLLNLLLLHLFDVPSPPAPFIGVFGGSTDHCCGRRLSSIMLVTCR